MAEKIKCDCGITFEVEEGQTHCNYCGKKLSDIGGKGKLSESQKKKIEEEEKYRDSIRKDLGKKKKGKGCLIAIGLLVGFFILIGVMSSGGKKEKPTPTPTPVKQEEPKATSEVASEEETEIAKYALKVAQISTQAAEAMAIRSETLGKWPNWTNNDVIRFAAAGISLENAYAMAKELTPPEIMVSVHQKMLKGFKLWADSVPITNKGIDDLNPEVIKKATKLIEEGNVWINEATKETEEIAEKLKQ